MSVSVLVLVSVPLLSVIAHWPSVIGHQRLLTPDACLLLFRGTRGAGSSAA